MSQLDKSLLPLSALQLALTTFVRTMVDHPDNVEVDVVDGGAANKLFRIRVAATDRGKLIGASGRTARSLRILLSAAGKKYKVALSLDIDS